jgi:hypothetical protein
MERSAGHSGPVSSLLNWTEAVGKRFGGVDIANGADALAPAIALCRHADL